jgi:plastocyanin domain-containing protein
MFGKKYQWLSSGINLINLEKVCFVVSTPDGVKVSFDNGKDVTLKLDMGVIKSLLKNGNPKK